MIVSLIVTLLVTLIVAVKVERKIGLEYKFESPKNVLFLWCIMVKNSMLLTLNSIYSKSTNGTKTFNTSF